MKTRITILGMALFFTSAALFSQSNHLKWAASIGGVGEELVQCMLDDANGNIYLAGSFTNAMDADPGANELLLTSNGDRDLFIIKLDPDGALIWARSIGGNGVDEAHSLMMDGNGDLYCGGTFTSSNIDFDPGVGTYVLNTSGKEDIFMLKLSSNGIFDWVVQIGGSGADNISGLDVDGNDNVLFTGQFYNTVDFDPGTGIQNLVSQGYASYVVKLDMNGEFVWARHFEGDVPRGRDLVIDENNYVLSVGEFAGKVDMDPGQEIFELIAEGNFDIYINKLDDEGNFIAAWQFRGPGDERINDIMLDAQGNLVTVGSFTETVDFNPKKETHFHTSLAVFDAFVCRLSPEGDMLWVGQPEGLGTDDATSVNQDQSGNLYVTGYIGGLTDFELGPVKSEVGALNQEAFLWKLNKDNELCWVHALGGSGDDAGMGIQIDINGDILTAGNYMNTVDFDPGTSEFELTSQGLTDVFVQKLNATTGIPDHNLSDEGFYLWPNPSSGFVYMDTDFNYDLLQVKVKDVSGRLISEKYYRGAGPIQIDLGDDAGLYLLEVILDQNQRYTVKAIVK